MVDGPRRPDTVISQRNTPLLHLVFPVPARAQGSSALIPPPLSIAAHSPCAPALPLFSDMSLPASSVNAIHSPPFKHDFHTLDEQVRRAKCVFRIWEPTSASPLIWTGHEDTSGFASPNGNLARLDSETYIKIYRENRGGAAWAEGAYMKQTVVDHILRKRRQTALCYPGMVCDEEGYDLPEDDKTPWISTSKSLAWCIWEVARRLAAVAAPLPDVNPDDPNGIDPRNEVSWKRARRQAVLNLAVIRHHSGTMGLQHARRMLLEAHIDPKGPTGRINREAMSVSLQGDYDAARRSAITSAEVLYYGRIFAENIDSNVEWTISQTPFPLPPSYFVRTQPSRPVSPAPDSSEINSDLGGWLKELVWNPYLDDYDTAMRKVEWRRRALDQSQGWQESSVGLSGWERKQEQWSVRSISGGHRGRRRGRGRGRQRGWGA